ncbi:peptide ABC transporter substrate-binding protein [Streptomyces armeniacus]|uniref:Peptide ABC transporter substrate-binding protein n=1 Tax=Streptomyces armeniacus TaxID=83291 RepID=A0A345XZG3_9ACTN|nr:peptide ABC transporter substrate-binding protein [Streptomyces armeniacus]AXK37029.1 peptide ABC transporter substrate-binding protein [Streptomyces armeniacus]
MSQRTEQPARKPAGPKQATVVCGVALAVLVAGCTGSDGTEPGAASHSAVPVKKGGNLVIGAEAEPDCADWISVCSGSIWGTYMMKTQTIPKVFDVRRKGPDWVAKASEMMAEEPAVAPGRQQKITYKLHPDAVWSDGKPITSADLKYTALQIRDGKDIFDKTGYDKIASVSTPDAKTAVVTLKEPYAGWRTLFSGDYGVLPEHLLGGKDRHKIMKDGYRFSGGPWKIQSWKRGSSVTLVPNDRYWGRKPTLDKVTFQFTADTAAAFQAFKSGQLDALYPTPQIDVMEQLEGMSGTNKLVDPDTGNLEALWLNNDEFPFDSLPVRKAVAYAVDRAAIVKKLYGSLGVEKPSQSFVTPMVGQYGGSDFSKYTRDLKAVDQEMKGAGWRKDKDGLWAKDGRTAAFTLVSLAGNKRRELTEQILQTQLKQAGFRAAIKNTSAAELFGKRAPSGDFQMGLWTLIDTFPNPALSNTFSEVSIPTEENGQSGLNFIRSKVDGLDPLLRDVDRELDEKRRASASLKADKVIAENVPSIPVGTVPNILLWNKRVGGRISLNPSEGPWWNLEEWGVAK